MKILNKFYLILALSMAAPAGLKSHVLTKSLTHATSKTLSRLSLKFNKLASCFTPQHIALVARAEIKRPSFWLGLVGAICLFNASKFNSDILRLKAREEQLNSVLLHIDERLKHSVREREAMRRECDNIPLTLSQKQRRKQQIKNYGLGLSFFAAIARYNGY